MPDKPRRVAPKLDDDGEFRPLPPGRAERLLSPVIDDQSLETLAEPPAQPSSDPASKLADGSVDTRPLDSELDDLAADTAPSPGTTANRSAASNDKAATHPRMRTLPPASPTRAIYKVKRSVPAPIRWLGWAMLATVLASLALIAPWALVNPPTSSFMVQDALANERPVKQRWVDADAISDTMFAAAIAAEDQRFYQHFGFDVESMREAWEAHQRGEALRGASTITQQTVKNLWLTPHRSVIRKGIEAWLTGVAEVVWTKKRTLTLYVNLAQFGDGLYGVEAASQHYFGKPASALSRSDAAWLAVLLPAPTRYRIDPPTDYTRRQHAWILSQMAPTVGR